jgi:PhzF family phenazine biosynthesis protein
VEKKFLPKNLKENILVQKNGIIGDNMKVKVKKVNAFTESIDGGNPAGVVYNSPDLTPKQMSKITKILNVSESAFFFSSSKADFKVLFFTPTVEVELCGHATIASFFTMGLEGMIEHNTVLTQETKAGILPVELYFSDGKINKVMMTQAKPILKDISLDISEIAKSVGITTDEIDTSLPKQLTSTSLFTMPICVKSFDILKSLKPDFKEIERICTKYNTGSYFVYTFDTLNPESTYHGRCFCPLYGINEDPTTGTANGAVSAYLVKNKIIKEKNLICEQGDIIGQPGRIFVEIKNDTVKVGGKAKIVEEKELEI